MNPIKNRKDLEATIDDIRNYAYSYLEKYSPSNQQLRTYLFKKVIKVHQAKSNKKELFTLIDSVILSLEDQKLISDKFYSHSKAKSLIQRGSSINKIRNYLISKGINDKYIKETISKIKDENEDQDFFSAIKICKKKELAHQDTRTTDLYFIKKIYQF